MTKRTTTIALFHCTNCFNRNTVTVNARWLRRSITLVLTVTLALTMGAGAIALYVML